MRFSYLLLLVFFHPALICMEMDAEQEEMPSLITDGQAFILYQPKSLFDIAANLLAEVLLEKKSEGDPLDFLTELDDLLPQQALSKIVSHISQLQGPALWKLFPYKIEHFDLDLSNTANIGLTSNDDLITLEKTATDAKIVIRNLSTRNILLQFPVSPKASFLKLTAYSNILFLSSSDGIIYIYNIVTGNLIKKITRYSDQEFPSIAISNSGLYIYQFKGTAISILNTLTSENVQIDEEESFQADESNIERIQTISNERFITTSENGSKLKIWQLNINEDGTITNWPHLLKPISTMQRILEISHNGKSAIAEIHILEASALYIFSLENYSLKCIAASRCTKRPESNFDGTLFLVPAGRVSYLGYTTSLDFKSLILVDTSSKESIITFDLDDQEFRSHTFYSFFITSDNRSIILYTLEGHFIKISLRFDNLEDILNRLYNSQYKLFRMPKCLIS